MCDYFTFSLDQILCGVSYPSCYYGYSVRLQKKERGTSSEREKSSKNFLLLLLHHLDVCRYVPILSFNRKRCFLSSAFPLGVPFHFLDSLFSQVETFERRVAMDFFFGFSGLPADFGTYKVVKVKEWVIGEVPATTKLVPRIKVPLSIKVGKVENINSQKTKKR